MIYTHQHKLIDWKQKERNKEEKAVVEHALHFDKENSKKKKKQDLFLLIFDDQ